MAGERSWTDRRMDVVIGNLLRVGVLVSALVVLFGGVLYLARNGHSPTDYRVFRGEPSQLRSVGGILRDADRFEREGHYPARTTAAYRNSGCAGRLLDLWIRGRARPLVCRRSIGRASNFGLQPDRVRLICVNAC